jgi:hypothetical protein
MVIYVKVIHVTPNLLLIAIYERLN